MRSIDNPSLSLFSRPSTAFALLTVFYIAFMFLPRLSPMGMFGDGLLYASLSRNLAEGIGSWWAPYFSSGYWLTEVAPDAYWENPPMMFWIQAVFFRVLGDHWWVEKLYSLLLLAVNCILIARVWSIPWRDTVIGAKSLAWLPVWFFYFIPIVVWGSPQNLIDSQLLMFCLVALWCLLKAIISQQQSVLLLAAAAIFIFGGILTKGPVALYPICAPALYGLILDRRYFRQGVAWSVLVFASVIILFLLLIFLHEPARFFFTQYWEQRLSVAIEGGRADGLRTGWERLYIFWLLLRENAMILPISLVLVFVAWRKNLVTKAYNYERRVSLFFLILGCCATVPVMTSTRQAGMYLIPGLVLFAMAAGYLHAPLFNYWFQRISAKASRIISLLAVTGIVAVIVHAGMIAGSPGREKALLADLPALQKHIPAGSEVAVCHTMMTNFVYHVYLQRFHHLALTEDSRRVNYFLIMNGCIEHDTVKLQANNFTPVYEGEHVDLFVRK